MVKSNGGVSEFKCLSWWKGWGNEWFIKTTSGDNKRIFPINDCQAQTAKKRVRALGFHGRGNLSTR